MSFDNNYLLRSEWKYICSDVDLDVVIFDMASVLELDKNAKKHNKYLVHSLYFDDYKNTCAFDNDIGYGKRFKWRIRYYDDDLSYISLERKEKINGLCRKKSCRITIDEYNKIINKDVEDLLYGDSDELLKRFCIDIMTNLFEPKIIIDYERVAYIEPISNVRITVDKNISASLMIDNFLDGSYNRYPIQEDKQHILEVKFDSVLPSYIQRPLLKNGLHRNTFSKYYLGRLILERNLL